MSDYSSSGDGALLVRFEGCVAQVIDTSKLDTVHVIGKSEIVDFSLGQINIPPSPNASSTNLAQPQPPPLPARSPSAASSNKLDPFSTTQRQRLDEWLIVSLPNKYTLPLPAIAQVTKDGDRAYLFPIEVELFPLNEKAAYERFGSNCRLRVVLPLGTSPDEQLLLEEILANRTAFVPDATNPFSDHRGQVVMVDEADGSVVGVLASTDVKDELPVDADPLHSKDPVIVTASADSGGRQLLKIEPLVYQPVEGYGSSKIVGLGNLVSRGIILSANLVSTGLNAATNKYVASSPRVTPERSMSIHPTARSTVDTIHGASVNAAKVTGVTAMAIGTVAERVGSKIGSGLGLRSKDKAPATTKDANGVEQPVQVKHPTGVRGFVNRSLVAFNAVLEGAEHGGKHVLATAVESGARAAGHKYGDDMEHVVRKTLGVSNSVALVYIDVRGVSRRALLKSVGRAAIKGRTKDGKIIEFKPDEPAQGTGHLQLPGPSSGRTSPAPEYNNDDWKPPVPKR